MSEREQVGEGWAVVIRPGVHAKHEHWLNASGGYVFGREGRMVWADYDDALDASHRWDGNAPRIVRVRYLRVSP